MRERIEILIGVLVVIAVVGCLAVSQARPGSGWGALPGAGPADAAAAER